MTTDEFAQALGVKPETVYVHLCTRGSSYQGATPTKLPNGQWLWPDDAVEIAARYNQARHTRTPLVEYFWRHTNKSDGDEDCWLWVGPKSNGRGAIRQGGRGTSQLSAARVSWSLANGEIPRGYAIQNDCADRNCVRPSHMSCISRAEQNARTQSKLPPRQLRDLSERFWEKVDKQTSPDGCWLWKGANRGHGYGAIRIGGRGVQTMPPATHAAWFLAYGYLPSAGMFVCHRCDVPACVRAEHLFLGTAKDNTRDAMSKGRHPPPPPRRKRASHA